MIRKKTARPALVAFDENSCICTGLYAPTLGHCLGHHPGAAIMSHCQKDGEPKSRGHEDHLVAHDCGRSACKSCRRKPSLNEGAATCHSRVSTSQATIDISGNKKLLPSTLPSQVDATC